MSGAHPPRASGRSDDRRGDLRAAMEGILKECEGARAAVVMGFDGIAVESLSLDSGVDVQTVGMELSFVLGQVRKAAEVLEVGGLQEVCVTSKNLTFIVRVLSDDHFLGLAMKPEGNFGKARFLARMALPHLRSYI